MDRPSNRRDHTDKKVNATGKSDSERWKRSSLYAMPTDKPRPESTQETTCERTSDSRDRPAYRDGRLRLAQQRQQAYQKDCYITPNLSASSISRSRRLGSDVNERNFNTSELGVPKGWKDTDDDTAQQQAHMWYDEQTPEVQLRVRIEAMQRESKEMLRRARESLQRAEELHAQESAAAGSGTAGT